MNKPVSVIIPVLNAQRYINGCLDALIRQDERPDSFEVILVDNGSTDCTLEKAKKYSNGLDLKVFNLPGVTISSLRNFGARNAQGDILAFLDADCVVGEDWIGKGKEQLKAGKSNNIGIAGSAYDIPVNSYWVVKAWHLNPSNSSFAGETDWLPSGNMFIDKNAFFEVGGFNELLETNEDYDICQRMKERGYSIFSNPRIRAVHLGAPWTLIGFFKKQLWHGRTVFRVFLDSLLNRKGMKNTKAVFFALLYVFILIAMFISVIVSVKERIIAPILAMVLLGIFPALMLSVATAISRKEYKYIPGLTILYVAYGIARAICIINLSWLRQGRQEQNG